MSRKLSGWGNRPTEVDFAVAKSWGRAKTLTRPQVRQVAQGSFPGLECSYTEKQDHLTTVGTLRVGAATHVVSCPRGKERDLRAEMVNVLRRSWETITGEKIPS